MFIIKVLTLLFAFDIYSWQAAIYDKVKSFNYPTYPATTTIARDMYSFDFESYAIARSPYNKSNNVINEYSTIPSWLLRIRHKGKYHNALSHRGMHNNVPCNIFVDNKLLIHISTIGVIKADIVFQVSYFVEYTPFGIMALVNIDNSYAFNDISDFKMMLWIFPHPTLKNMDVVVVHGYISSSAPAKLIMNYVKWHIDNALQNIGERLMTQ